MKGMTFEIHLSQEEVEALGVGSAEEAIDLIHGFIADYTDVDKKDEDLEFNDVEVLDTKITELEKRIDKMSVEELRQYLNKLLGGENT